jgi:hypothetical protein
MGSSRIRVYVVAILLCLSAWQGARAQVSGGTITGLVTDPSGAFIQNAHLTIVDLSTLVKREITTNTDGAFSAPNLKPGAYSIKAEASGFQTQIRENLVVTVGGVMEVNFPMTVGSMSEKVEVTTVNPPIELGSSQISGVVTGGRIRELPLNGRDWTQLATLEPGVSQIRTENALGNRVQQGEGTQLSISGSRPWQNNYRLDGISINDYANSAPGSALGVNLGVDAIAEFSVISSGYPAEYGRSSGGVVTAATRSGTTQFHGSAYEFFRDSFLDSRSYFDTVKPEFRRNQFGGSIGGPLFRDKTFFFADYEGIRQTLGITQTSLVPTASARAGQLSSGTVTVDPGVLRFINAFYPLPNGAIDASGDTGAFKFANPQSTSENFVTGKVDHHFSQKDSLDGTYLFDIGSTAQPDELNNKQFGYSTHRNLFTMEEDHAIGSAFLNAARLGFNRVVALEGQTPSGTAAAGDPSYGSAPGKDAAQVTVPGLVTFTGGLGAFSQHYYHFNDFQVNDDAFFTRGIHSFKFGASMERIQDNEFAVASPTGAFKFGSLANFLTNRPKSFQGVLPGSLSERGIRTRIVGLYFQDDLRLRKNLIFNLGMRYELSTVPSEVNGKLATLRNLTDATPHLGSPFFSNPTLRNFEPRLGFSWDPFGKGQTAIRGGFGMFDILPLPYLFELVTEFSAPFFQQGNITTLPQGTFPTGAYGLISGNSNTLRSAYVQPHPSRNYVMNWNLNVQQSLPLRITAMVAYVGSRSVHNATPQEDLDTVLPTITPAGLLYPINGDRLNPNFGRISGVQWIGMATYHALQIKVNKSLSHGLQAQGSYTWSKSLDTGSTSVGTDAFSNSLTNTQYILPRLNKGPSDFDARHNATIHFTWALGGEERAGASTSGKRALLTHGWELGSILQLSSGTPFSMILGGDPTGQGTVNVEDLPNRDYSRQCANLVNSGNPRGYVKTNCFSFPNPVNLYGNAGRNSLVGPGLLDLDASLIKNNRLSERVNAQFRLESFNVINHTNFSAPLDNNVIFDDTGALVPGVGTIDSTQNPARIVQLGVKVIF